MSLIIKRWNGSSFDELYPKTKAGMIYASDGSTTIFDENTKIKPAYLPDSVFDSLLFFGTILPGTTSPLQQAQATVIASMIAAANSAGRSPVGYYLVASASGSVEPFTGQITVGEPETLKYVTLTLQGGDIGSTSTTTTGTMEAGDWIVITSFSGAGTSGSPYVVSATVINNVYETATSTVPGIVKYGASGTQTTAANAVTTIADRTYAVQNNGSNQMVVNVPWTDTVYSHPTYSYSDAAGTETTLSDITLIDSISATNGHITASTSRKLVAGSNVTITPESNGNITISSTDTNTTYFEKPLGGLSLDGNEFEMVHPLFVQANEPSTPLPGTIWFDI